LQIYNADVDDFEIVLIYLVRKTLKLVETHKTCEVVKGLLLIIKVDDRWGTFPPTFTNKNVKEKFKMASKYKKISVNGRKIDEHRYIMEQHLGRRLESWEVVHHKDGDKFNNDLSNLELMTREEHSREHMLGNVISYDVKKKLSESNKGKHYHNRKLSDEQVRYIRLLSEDGMSGRAIARKLNLDRNTVHSILRSETYKDVA
jgi:hypothetical protein